MLAARILICLTGALVSASPLTPAKRWEYEQYFDILAHRGNRGRTVENTLPAFAWGMIEGATSLEMDCGLTQDGHPIVWHDQSITAGKCLDTAPVTPDDPMFPYVGKYIANLTLAQIKTLDCGSQRQSDFPLQEVYPGTKISTYQEVFDFVACASDDILFMIESKVNPVQTNRTRSPEDFMMALNEVFEAQGPDVYDRITLQSFDWRTLVIANEQYPNLRTMVLFDDRKLWGEISPTETGNLTTHGSGPSAWLGGLDIDDFEGETVGERVTRAAHSIGAEIISPNFYALAGNTSDPAKPGFVDLVNATMVDTAHSLGMLVKPGTPNEKNALEKLLALGIDGIITDYVLEFRRNLERKEGYSLPPLGDKDRILKCLDQHLQNTEAQIGSQGYKVTA